MVKNSYSLFSVFGIEMEYMIVQRDTLAIVPIADKLIGSVAGEITSEVECGDVALNNELALHIIELKTNGPTANLIGLDKKFHHQLVELNTILNNDNATLMPTGTHPFFIPDRNIALWPHDDQIIYQTYNKIFDCNGHGWSNLQSVHINLPFANNDEFTKLHSAIRIILPLIPALAASTPFSEGKLSDALDTRLLHYGKNQALLPQIAGDIIPEFVGSIDAYHTDILIPMYDAISPHDPDKILQHEWLNSRGAIARFERDAIEIRVTDIQESPLMDLAVISSIVAAIKYIIANNELFITQPLSASELKQLYNNAIYFGFDAEVTDTDYLSQLGLSANKCSMREIWQHLIHNGADEATTYYTKPIQFILNNGSLAQRLKAAYLKNPQRETINKLFLNLCKCLEQNGTFHGD